MKIEIEIVETKYTDLLEYLFQVFGVDGKKYLEESVKTDLESRMLDLKSICSAPL